jgi:hypothetical protein
MELSDLTAEDTLSAQAIDDRIDELRGLLVLASLDADEEVEYQEERAALAEFKEQLGGEWKDDLQFISESRWVKFAAEEARGIYGKMAVDSVYWGDVKWAEDMTADYGEATLGGIVFRYRL